MLPEPAIVRHRTKHGLIEEAGPSGLLADHATTFLLEHLTINPGETVAEPGCGTGVLSLFAGRAGAALVTGTDTDERALAAARTNARRNGLADVHFLRGNLLEAVRGPFDVILANVPHKPAPTPFNPRYYGGRDGTDLLLAVVRQAETRLGSGGRLYLYHNSIAYPGKLRSVLDAAFAVRVLAEKKRHFTSGEFNALVPGMMEHLERQRQNGEAEFDSDANGLFFNARILECRRR